MFQVAFDGDEVFGATSPVVRALGPIVDARRQDYLRRSCAVAAEALEAPEAERVVLLEISRLYASLGQAARTDVTPDRSRDRTPQQLDRTSLAWRHIDLTDEAREPPGPVDRDG